MTTTWNARTASCLLGLAALAAPPALAADAKHPAVVELFESQGCSSCPPANANLIALADRPDILALTFAVDYWDRLGWKDTFAKPKFTDRQYEYASALKHSDVFTPQVVVNGRIDGVGATPGEMESLAAQTDRGDSGPSLVIKGGAVHIGAGKAPANGADVWLAFYDPRVLEVDVTRGENAGHTLAHRNIVRDLVLLGHWSGEAAQFPLPAAGADTARAVLVQTSGLGPILAATKG